MFWRTWSWSQLILSGVVSVVAAAILFPVFVRSRDLCSSRISCASNLKQIGLALRQYSYDYGNSTPFPLVATGGAAYGWADALEPYLKSVQLYQCPLDKHPAQSNPRLSGYCDYAFNARLSGLNLVMITKPDTRLLVSEGNDGSAVTDARYALAKVPFAWVGDESSPLYRHKGRANVLFADGHVTMCLPASIGTPRVAF